MLSIAVIGSGWLGSHLATKLKQNHKVTLYESSDFFAGTSLKNQNRLHMGYHYARNAPTRELCLKTFQRFCHDYSESLTLIPNNIYAIPLKSIIDFPTYLKIFDEKNHKEIKTPYLKNIEGAIVVNEHYIDPKISQSLFFNKLKDNICYEKIEDIKALSRKYDYVLNCTNNKLNPIEENTFSEPCGVLVYNKIKTPPFGALTLVDGDFFSIFPYINNTITLTDVQYTPSGLSEKEQKNKSEEKVKQYFPDFDKYFSYSHIFYSLKVKQISQSSTRVPIIKKEDNVISCFTGKIQGIYYLEDYVKTLCEF